MGLSQYRRFTAKDDPAADFAASVFGKDIVNGRLTSGTIKAGASSTIVSHGLGRAYKGAFCVGSSAPSSNGIGAYTPELGVALGVDVTKQIRVDAFVIAGADLTFTLWVF